MKPTRGATSSPLGPALIGLVVALWASLGFLAAWHARAHEVAARVGATCAHECRHAPAAPDQPPPGERRDDCGTCVQLMVARPKAAHVPPAPLVCLAHRVEVTPRLADQAVTHAVAPFVRTSRGPPAV